MKINSLFKLLRVHHYIKNIFIFMPLFFAGKINNLELLSDAFIGFFAFSAIASSVYIINDLKDIKEDLHHPRKKFRPLASGEIDKKYALLVMFFSAVLSFSLSSSLLSPALIIIFAYFILNLAYSFYLKHIVIMDVNVIALGFVLRILFGSEITGTVLSVWIVIMTYLLALFLALAKRREDVLIFVNSGQKMRKVIDGYNIKFIDSALIFVASIIMIIYILFTISNEVQQRIQNEYLYLTALFVILGLVRYLYLSFVTKNTGSPITIIFKDRHIQVLVLLWLIAYAYIIYL
jgi:decaprenyl-phosphate phosphoribosyltransferase